MREPLPAYRGIAVGCEMPYHIPAVATTPSIPFYETEPVLQTPEFHACAKVTVYSTASPRTVGEIESFEVPSVSTNKSVVSIIAASIIGGLLVLSLIVFLILRARRRLVLRQDTQLLEQEMATLLNASLNGSAPESQQRNYFIPQS